MTEIRDEDHLAAIFKENSKVVIDFTADWCGPCQKIKKDYEKLSDAISDVSFVKVNVDDNPVCASENLQGEAFLSRFRTNHPSARFQMLISGSIIYLQDVGGHLILGDTAYHFTNVSLFISQFYL